jgi:RHS repeat-associated protein
MSDGVTPFFEEEQEYHASDVTRLKWKHYINTPEGIVGLVVLSNGGFGRRDIVFARDHLGSNVGVIDGTLESHGYDAWGMRRNPDGSANPNLPAASMDRGYTGHEMMDAVGLIHMNGRIYDPKLGRFLQADPIIQAPFNLQSYNRYSYVLNNPLVYTDPSGFSWWTEKGRPVFRAVVAAVASYFTAGWASSWYMNYAATTLCTAGAGAPVMIGNVYATSAIVGGAAGGFAAGGIMGGNLQAAMSAAIAGGLTVGIGSVYGNTYSIDRVAAEVAAGGVINRIEGGSFSDGALRAGIFSLLTAGNWLMRQDTIEHSSINPDNANGESAGFMGDRFAAAGARREYDAFHDQRPCASPFGGCQGKVLNSVRDQAKNMLGISYKPGDFLDYLGEAYAGPHDWLRRITGAYTSAGNSVHYSSRFAAFLDNYVANGILLAPATPFAVGGLIQTRFPAIIHLRSANEKK